MKINRAFCATLMTAALLVVGLSPAAAIASEQDPAAQETTEVEVEPMATVTRTMINKKTLSTSYVNKNDRLAECKITTNGGNCSIMRSETAIRTIGLSLGATRSWAAGELGISSSAGMTTAISCNSGPMKSGQIWKAWPIGSRYSYQIRRLTIYGGQQYPVTETSRLLYAFNPRQNAVACGL